MPRTRTRVMYLIHLIDGRIGVTRLSPSTRVVAPITSSHFELAPATISSPVQQNCAKGSSRSAIYQSCLSDMWSRTWSMYFPLHRRTFTQKLNHHDTESAVYLADWTFRARLWDRSLEYGTRSLSRMGFTRTQMPRPRSFRRAHIIPHLQAFRVSAQDLDRFLISLELWALQ